MTEGSMASPTVADLGPCEAWILAGAKPRAQFRVGTEYERILVGADGKPLPWDGEPGIHQVLQGLRDRFGWQPELERGLPIALLRDGASITLEPAGQFELSGAPLASVTAMKAELDSHLAELDAVLEPWGVRSAYVGMNPETRLGDEPHMPKARYNIMRAWMPEVGAKGLQMMHLTCTVQSNLDFHSGTDAMSLLRAGFLATPVIIALFANSPFRFGHDTGLASARADVWLDVDAARCDLGAVAFDPGATVRDYVEWAADVPMYFVRHVQADGSKAYLSPERRGLTFRQFLSEGDRGRGAVLDDWITHLSTLFPDVRLKRYVEIRAADCVPPELLPALPALSVGLLQDPTSRAELMALLRDGDRSVDRAALRAAACRDGLDGQVGSWSLRSLARQCVELAQSGLARVSAGAPDPAGEAALAALQDLAEGTRPALWQTTRDALLREPTLSAVAS